MSEAASSRSCSTRSSSSSLPSTQQQPRTVVCHGLCDTPEVCVCSQKCKWCKRSFGSPHPLGKAGETLPRKRGRGKECDVCVNTLNWKYLGETRADVLAQIDKFPAKQAEFDEHVAAWELKHKKDELQNPSKRIRKVKEASLNTHRVQEYELTTLMGYIWPADLWSSHTGKEIPKHRIQYYDICDPPLAGILELPSFGWKQGVTELKRRATKGSGLTINAGSTEEDLDVKELEARQRQFQDYARMDVVEKDVSTKSLLASNQVLKVVLSIDFVFK